MPPIRNSEFHLGNNVCLVRILKGYTQNYVAFKLGISQQAYARIEQKRYIPPDNVRRIALILECPIEAIKNISQENIDRFLESYSKNRL